MTDYIGGIDEDSGKTSLGKTFWERHFSKDLSHEQAIAKREANSKQNRTGKDPKAEAQPDPLV